MTSYDVARIMLLALDEGIYVAVQRVAAPGGARAIVPAGDTAGAGGGGGAGRAGRGRACQMLLATSSNALCTLVCSVRWHNMTWRAVCGRP